MTVVLLRVSVLLTGSVPEGEDLLQTSLVRLYRAWPRLDVSSSAPDAYLRKVLVNTRRSWWQVFKNLAGSSCVASGSLTGRPVALSSSGELL